MHIFYENLLIFKRGNTISNLHSRRRQFGVLVCRGIGAGGTTQDRRQGRAPHWPLHSVPDWGVPGKAAVVKSFAFIFRTNFKPRIINQTNRAIKRVSFWEFQPTAV